MTTETKTDWAELVGLTRQWVAWAKGDIAEAMRRLHKAGAEDPDTPAAARGFYDKVVDGFMSLDGLIEFGRQAAEQLKAMENQRTEDEARLQRMQGEARDGM